MTNSNISSRMTLAVQEIVTEYNGDGSYSPDIPYDIRRRMKTATAECYDNMMAVEKEEELTLCPLYPNAPQYFPLAHMEDKATVVSITKHVNQCDNRLLDEDDEEIANFTVLNDRVLVTRSKGKPEVEFTVASANGFERRLCLPIAVFRDGNWYRDYQGLTCQNPRLLREYLETLCGDILENEKFKVQSEGWYKDKKDNWRMITHQGNVVDSTYSVEVEEDGSRIYSVPGYDEVDLARYFWDMRLLTKSKAAIIVMAYIILSALYTFFSNAGVVPKFILGILGPRSSRKTSLAMTMANLYKREPGMSPSVTFKTATPAGIEQNLRKFKDAVMIVDDLMPTTDKTLQRRIESALEHICRLFGDASETARNTDFLSEERAEKINYKAAGLCVFTGEYFTGVASSRSRCVTLKIRQDTVNNELLSFYQSNLDILPGFLWDFLAYVEKNQTEIFQFIKENVILVRRDFQNTYEVARFAEYQAQMETAMSILFAYFTHLGLMSDEVLEHELHVFRDEFRYVLLENQREMVEADPISQIRRTIQNFCEESSCMIGDVENTCPLKADLYVSKNYFYIYPPWLFARISEYAKARGESSTIIDVPNLKSVLDSSGFLVRKRDGKINRYTTKLPKAAKIHDNRRFFCISKDILDSEQA